MTRSPKSLRAPLAADLRPPGGKPGPRRRANSPSSVASSQGAGYGVPNPMLTARATRARCVVRWSQLDLFEGVALPSATQAKRGGEGARSAP